MNNILPLLDQKGRMFYIKKCKNTCNCTSTPYIIMCCIGFIYFINVLFCSLYFTKFLFSEITCMFFPVKIKAAYALLLRAIIEVSTLFIFKSP